jgi:hypothetical protein
LCGKRDIPTNAYGESALLPISAFDDGHLPAKEGARAIEDFVAMAMVAAGCMRVRVAVVKVGHFDRVSVCSN